MRWGVTIATSIQFLRGKQYELPPRAKEKQLPEEAEAPDRPEPRHTGSSPARAGDRTQPNVGTVSHPVLPRCGPHFHPRPRGAVYRLGGQPGGCNQAAGPSRYKPSIARKRAFKQEGANAMKKYQLTGQPIYVGETYNHNGDLYRVESFD